MKEENIWGGESEEEGHLGKLQLWQKNLCYTRMEKLKIAFFFKYHKPVLSELNSGNNVVGLQILSLIIL